MTPRIDVHSHYLPDFYWEACVKHGYSKPDGMPALPKWSVEGHLQLMDKLNIAKSYISVSSPGTHLVYGDDALAIKLSRDVNKFAADLKREKPDRFGFFASLPMPLVEASCKEIEKAISEGCDGFVLHTNSHGVYLGNKQLDPIFDELNRRKAIVFIHPTTPQLPCSNGYTQPVDAAPFGGTYPNPMLEFFFETARIITNLFLSGTMKRCPNITYIMPHLGGAFPPLLSRWATFSQVILGSDQAVSEKEAREAMEKQFFFDMAGFPFPGQLRGLLAGVQISPQRIMYGSDFPFTNLDAVSGLAKQMDGGVKELFSQDEIEDIMHRNAKKLFKS
ncbi:amidohydrolase 2 [Piedraia hortae CBS 480.64]|uniref:6-methylsalicylate decarboxylase n=1 Tax=Piedraia hortae CBS 480.64 TaxID=1314780 RepID=A0A6A7BXB1_9PEZI|nr:amidohydrolase 2 [Piedraia hortae CBS 480.64]